MLHLWEWLYKKILYFAPQHVATSVGQKWWLIFTLYDIISWLKFFHFNKPSKVLVSIKMVSGQPVGLQNALKVEGFTW